MTFTEEEEELSRFRKSVGTSSASITAGQAAPHAYALNQLQGAQALGEIGGFDTTTLDQYRAQQEQALSHYQPRLQSLFDAKNLDEGVEWWKDQAMLNSMNQIVPMLGYVAGGILQAVPYVPAKILGKIITGTTFATQYNANLGDTLSEHEERAGRKLSTQEKMWAGGVSGLVTALDYLTPGKVSKDVVKSMGGMKNVIKTRSKLIKELKVTRQSLSKSLATGTKYASGIAGREFVTEGAQKAVQIGTSVDPGYLGTTEGVQSVVQEGLAAGPTSAIISSPQAVMEGGAHNRGINRARQQAKSFNREMLEADADIFEKTGIDPKDFNKLEITDIPERGGLSGAIAKKSKEWGLTSIGETIGDVGVFKAPMEIKRLRDNATTGEDYSRLNNILQSFLPTGSSSGEAQKTLNFDALKSTLHGELLADVTEILNRYSNKKFAGLGAPVLSPEANKQIKDAMENRKSISSSVGPVSRTDLELIAEKMDEAGVLLRKSTKSGFVENYIQKPVSVDNVKNNKEGFIQSLLESSKTAYYKSTKKADEKTNFIYQPNDEVGNRERANNIATDIIEGRDPNIVSSKFIKDQAKDKKGKEKESFEKSRSKEWENLADEFRESDVGRIIEGYLSKAATRVASAETFGAKNADKLQGNINALSKSGAIDQEGINKVWDLYDAVHNVYKRDVSKAQSDLRKVSKVATQVTAITHLGLATLSSLSELAWVGERVGFGNMLLTLPAALNYTRKGVKKGLGGKPMTESEGWQTLANLGLNLNPHVNDRLDQMFSTDKSSILNAYFRSPFGMFLTQWTNFNRNWAAQAGMTMMNRRAKGLVNGTIDPMDERRLRNELKENGITLNEFKQLADLSRDEKGNININIINNDYLSKEVTKDNGTTTRVRDILVPWVHKIVDDVVVHPKAHNKPLWMSDPSFAMIAQLKTFPIVFGNTVVKRLLRKLNPNTCSPDFGLALSVIGGIAAAYALAMLGEEIKSAIRQQDPRDVGWVDAGNMTGLTGAAGLIAGGAKFGDLTSSLIGPSYDAINTAATKLINPFLEGEPLDAGVNLIEWFGSAVDSSLGAAGIYFTPFEGDD
jgi:hypothetical protein